MQVYICFLAKALFLRSGPLFLEGCQSFGFNRCEAYREPSVKPDVAWAPGPIVWKVLGFESL